jgi:hypothetical protein
MLSRTRRWQVDHWRSHQRGALGGAQDGLGGSYFWREEGTLHRRSIVEPYCEGKGKKQVVEMQIYKNKNLETNNLWSLVLECPNIKKEKTDNIHTNLPQSPVS